jgi:diguanylate cyclase (GGDEF)-like protein
MHKILFCSAKKASLPFPCDKTSKFKDIFRSEHRIVILPEELIKKIKKPKISLLSKEKVCLAYFSYFSKSNLSLVKKFGLFDYFSAQEDKSAITFKLKRALGVAELKEKLGNLETHIGKKQKQIDKFSLVDPLTSCYNWRYFLSRAQQELDRSRRHLYSVSFIAIDVDYFRQINEVYGVKAADDVIKQLIAVLRASLRREDVLCRWREDEFFLIMPHLEAKNAPRVTQRIKDKVTAHKFKYKSSIITIKASFGVVTSPEDGIFNTRDIITALNRSLMAAKRKGGNTVIAYSQAQLKAPDQQEEKAKVGDLRAKIDKMNVLLTRDLLEMIYGFAKAIEAKDSYTGKHVEITADLAEEIAKNLNLPPNEVENIKHAAVLHDLGKVGIDQSILSKAGPLTPKERKAMERHPTIAAEILKEIHGLRGALPAILYHHERYDGKGYPFGLKGEEIPLSARIVAVADVYQALISDRPYRKAFNKKKALEIIQEEAGRQFDPNVVKIFLKAVEKDNAQRKR